MANTPTPKTPEQPKQAPAKAPEPGTDAGEIRYFSGTITKVDAQGRTVMSDHLMPGEQLRREVTNRYEASQGARQKSEAKPDKDN